MNVLKSYGNKKVVDHVSLKIEKGKITSFIGPNGAGKSTLLSIISRLTVSDSGEVYIDGEAVSRTNHKELAKKLAILKQSNHLNIRLTVRDLVSFGRFPYSQGKLKTEDERLINEAIAYMELEEYENQFLDSLSGGQRQRAYIAMVLAQNTEYILLDEPLNNLDMKHSVQIMKVLRRMANELGKTILIVIHDINFASFYSDSIIAMKNGKIVRQGSTSEIIQPAVLKEIYDMDIDIRDYCQNKVCLYFG
jgi:iron complex transport system ATP-binding protein